MNQFFNYIFLVQGIILITCTILQLTVKKNSAINNLMGLFFFLLAYLSFYFFSYQTGFLFKFPVLLYSDLGVTFLIGPVSYTYIKEIFGDNRFSTKSIIHYFPAILVFGFFILYYVTGNLAIKRDSIYPDYHSDILIYIISIFADLWFFVYFVFFIKKIYNFLYSGRFKSVLEIRIILYIFIGGIVSSVLLFPGHFLQNDALIVIASIQTSCFAIIYFIYSYRHPEYTQRVILKSRLKKESSFPFNDKDVCRILDELKIFIEEKTVYRNPEISIQFLSNMLGINSNHLSLILNEKMGMNFRAFINKYRLKEARKLLVENHEKSILEVAFYVGFNSKTNFNTLFMKTTGLTPSEYRKKY